MADGDAVICKYQPLGLVRKKRRRGGIVGENVRKRCASKGAGLMIRAIRFGRVLFVRFAVGTQPDRLGIDPRTDSDRKCLFRARHPASRHQHARGKHGNQQESGEASHRGGKTNHSAPLLLVSAERQTG